MHQYLFHIGDFPIRMYGLVLCMSIFLATGVAYFLAKQDGRWQQHILDIGIYGGFAGLIGGRLWDVFFFDWDYYQHHLLEIPFVWQGGMAIQGGVIAGVLAGIWYCKRHQIDWLALADIVCPAILIGQAIGGRHGRGGRSRVPRPDCRAHHPLESEIRVDHRAARRLLPHVLLGYREPDFRYPPRDL